MALSPITIAKDDRDRLLSIAKAALGSGRDNLAASTLLSEVGRARIVVQGPLPPEVVAVNAEVEIHDNITNKATRLRLVYPEDAALDSNKVSVLTRFGDARLVPDGTGRGEAKRYFNSALLVIDDVGCRPLDRSEANLFFRLVSARLSPFSKRSAIDVCAAFVIT